MKILFVANYMWDIYIFRAGVIKALVSDGHEVVVVAPDDGRIDMEKAIPGVKSISINLNKRGINPIEDLKLTLELYKLYKRENQDIIFHYTIKPNIYGGIICRLEKFSYIENITGLGSAFEKSGILKKLVIMMYKVALKKAKKVFFENVENRDVMVRYNTVCINKTNV